MPYINKTRRANISLGAQPENAGELNYQLTTMCIDYLTLNGERYQIYNDIIGALEGAKLELYARKVRPYEDTKIEENGDVY